MRFVLSLCLIASAAPLWSWGPTGHRVVARIAEQRLSPEVRARVARLLLDGQFSMAQVSTCPDALRSTGKYPIRPDDEYCLKIAANNATSGPWHYIDIPVPKAEKGLEAYCPKGSCITAKIKAFRDVLKNSNDDAQRREALMYLIHFMGDIHQPLHCAERQCDQGGNLEHVNITLRSGDRADRLHGAWDQDLVDKMMQTEKLADDDAMVTALASQIKPGQADKWRQATIDEIAWEGWTLAKEHVYKNIPVFNYCDPAVKAAPTPASNLTPAYEKDGVKVVHEQIMKASVRLAAILEEALTR